VSQFPAAMSVSAGDILMLSARNKVYPAVKSRRWSLVPSGSRLIGIALNGAKRGETVSVATSGTTVQVGKGFEVVSVRFTDSGSLRQVDFAPQVSEVERQ